jgi:hypothetical protein
MNFNYRIRTVLPGYTDGSVVAGIIKQVFLYYFKLGGVLVATTNRLPDGEI